MKKATVAQRATLVVTLAMIIALVLALASRSAHASTTFTVDKSDDSSAATACTDAPDDCSLRGAISRANNTAGADTINFAPDVTTLTLTYSETQSGNAVYENNNAEGDLDITDDLTIEGGSSGVIIEGGSGWNERIIDIIGATAAGNSTDVTIKDTTIRKGSATVGSNATVFGERPTVGGGIHVNGGANVVPNGSSLTLLRSTVTNNTSVQSGGGILDEFRSTIVLQDSTVSNNTAGNNVNGFGGGIHSAAGSLSLTNSTVTGNTGVDLGGGITTTFGTATITDSTISGNTAASSGGYTNGGGIYALGSGVNLTSSTVSGNTAESSADGDGAGQGGGIYADGATMTLKNATVSGNTAKNGSQLDADGDGGGIYTLGNADLTLANTTITSNKAGDPGTSGAGGGLFGTNGSSTTTLRNTIVAGNDADIAANFAATPTSQGYNLLGENPGGLAATDIVNSNPLLGPLQDNGGPTKTRALLSGSPAIDAGNPATPGGGVPACEATDQRGETRPTDGDGDSTATCDIGAFEKVAGGGGGGDVTPPTLNINNDVTPSNGATKVSRTTNVSATFSEPMDLDSLKAAGVFTVKNTKTGLTEPAASITLSPDGKKVTFDPSRAKLGKKTTYEVRIKGGSGGATDVAGNPLASDAVWSFTTKRK